jgi:23S rRNA (cytosine1962-C5)-methyltransferase
MATAYLVKRKEKRTEYGHPWIFRSDIDHVRGDLEPGDIVDVHDHKDKFLGRGYMNPGSQITIRMLTNIREDIDYDFFYRRILAAWEYRKKVADIDCCRVVFAEADLLPALIVDKYSDCLVVQTLALGIEKYLVQITGILNAVIKPLAIYERNDVPIRALEGLEPRKGFLSGSCDTKIRIRENGILFDADIENGQKTGYFLDQKENRLAIKPFVKDAKVLDCFCHTGSFAIHAAHFGARDVLGIDSSELAVGLAAGNAAINSLGDVCRFEEANVFEKLREYDDRNERFDVIILDPPAFTKSKKTVEGAIRGYKEINLRAMKILSEGGFLVTCSCSQHMDSELFLDILYDSAIDAKRTARLIEYRSQAKDHPVLLASEETGYLKCAILQII